MNVLPLLIALTILVFTDTAAASKPPVRFNVDVVGEGTPVLLIPGFLSDQRVWDDIAIPLSTQFELHRISIAGFGSTPKSQTPSLRGLKEQLLGYIKTKNLKDVVIVGHSLGGFMGMWIATESKNTISAVISVDGLPFIGPIFTQSSEVTVADLSSQASFLQSFYSELDSAGMRMAAKRGIHNQTKAEEHQAIILEMAAMSDPATASDAIYTIMTTDLRDQLSNVPAKITLLGASGGFPNEEMKQNTEALYQQELSNALKANVMMNTQSRHFIMYDDPQWLLNHIMAAIQEVE